MMERDNGACGLCLHILLRIRWSQSKKPDKTYAYHARREITGVAVIEKRGGGRKCVRSGMSVQGRADRMITDLTIFRGTVLMD